MIIDSVFTHLLLVPLCEINGSTSCLLSKVPTLTVLAETHKYTYPWLFFITYLSSINIKTPQVMFCLDLHTVIVFKLSIKLKDFNVAVFLIGFSSYLLAAHLYTWVLFSGEGLQVPDRQTHPSVWWESAALHWAAAAKTADSKYGVWEKVGILCIPVCKKKCANLSLV